MPMWRLDWVNLDVVVRQGVFYFAFRSNSIGSYGFLIIKLGKSPI